MHEIVVIGGGPAGVTAALRARELGVDVALVERGRLGGTCTNDGCVPTRVLAKAARLVRDAEQFAAYGLQGVKPTVDFPRVLMRTAAMVDRIHDKKRLRQSLEDVGVVVRAGVGDAAFQDAHTLLLPDGATIESEKFIICVGGHARRLPFPGGELALTHSDVWGLRALPRSVAVVGGAATGCQLASVFNAFGAEVTLLDLAPRLLPAEDQAVAEAITAAFVGHGIHIHTGISGIERIEQQADGLRLHYTHHDAPQTLDVEAVVLAVGWPGNVERLSLAVAGVEVERSYIKVNDHLQTTAEHIWAAGDITGRMMLVQSGTHEARVAAENAVLSLGRTFAHTIVPHGGFTDPEYASVGLTEEQARRLHDCVVATIPYAALDRAVIDGRHAGFCKLIVERRSRKIIGAHMVGEQAVEVAQLVAAAMIGGTRIEQLAQLELAYPTFTAIVGLAARQIAGELGVIPLASLRTVEWERSPGERT